MTDPHTPDKVAPELASRAARFGGWLVDAIISGILSLPLLGILGMFDNAGSGFGPTQLAVVFVFVPILHLVINGYFLATNGQTIGKKIAGTKIVDVETGDILSLPKVFLWRFIPFFLMSAVSLLQLIDALFIFRENKRCLHDLIAGTEVVRAE